MSSEDPLEGTRFALDRVGREKGEMRLIARAAAILRSLADHPSGMSLGELAKSTGLARATVQRVVGALEAERLVASTTNAYSIRLGLEIARLASFVQSDARELLRPFAEDVLRRVQETVDVTVVDGQSAIVIEQLASPQSLRVVSHVGRPLPIHCTASGKAHLAQMDTEQRRVLLNPTLQRCGPNTKTSVDDVLDEVAGSIDRGYFLDVEEYAEGVCAIAIDVPLSRSANYAIAVSMPAQRFAANAQTYTAMLLDVRAAIGTALKRSASGFAAPRF